MRREEQLRTSARDGNHAIAFALTLLVILGFASLVVDIGYQRTVKLQLEHGVQAAAHAGAAWLWQDDDSEQLARETAVSIASMNPVNGAPLRIDAGAEAANSGDVVFGSWDAGSFTPTEDFEQMNAIRVQGHARLDTLLAEVAFGREELGANAVATAVLPPPLGAGAADCFLPIAVPECRVTATREDAQLADLRLSPAGVDSVGWAGVNGEINADYVMDQIHDCGAVGRASVGEPVLLQNGRVNSGLAALAEELVVSDTRWDEEIWGEMPEQSSRSTIPSADYGRTYEGPIVVFDGGPGYCQGSGGSFNTTETITGFVWGAIFDVERSNGNFMVRLDVTTVRRLSDVSGGVNVGITYQPPPMLVH